MIQPNNSSSESLAFIDEIRSASRQLVREWGFLHTTLASTPYPPSAVHALVEIGAAGSLTAVEIAQLLGLEKSSVSRMLQKLVAAGELREQLHPDDARSKQLSLTPQGRRTLNTIHRHSRDQVAGALRQLAPAHQSAVKAGLTHYARALVGERTGTVAAATAVPEIVSGYRPGVVGRIAEMHASYYAQTYQFGQFFESKVATGAAEFVGRLVQGTHPGNGLWTVSEDQRIIASVAIDAEDLKDMDKGAAHLRWFIVDSTVRSSGLGRRLLQQALDFCDAQQMPRIHLWTFRGLDAARHLYESLGFQLAEEWTGTQWGSEVQEQHFVRTLGAASPSAPAK